MNLKTLLNHKTLVILLGILIGISVSISMIPLSVHTSLIIAGLIFLPIFIALAFIYKSTFLLFVLFCTFGIMNTPLKLFDLLFVVVAVIFFFLKRKKWEAIRNMRVIHLTLTLFLGVSVLSILSAKNTSLGISYFINTLFVISLFYFLAITIEKETEIKSIISGYIFTVLFSVFAVIAQKMGLIGDIGTWFQGIRAQGFFMDPNDFSPFLVFAIIYLLNKGFSYHSFSFKYAFFCALSALVSGVLLASMSRAAILDLVISLLIYFSYTVFYKKKYSQVIVCIGAIAVISVLIFIAAGDEIIQYLSIRFMGSTDVLQEYDKDRFFFQRQGLLMGSTHLFGIGPGQFEYTYGYATHNLFVRIIAENGWIAFFLIAAMIIYIFVLLIYFSKKEAWNLPVYLFLAVFIGMIVNSFFLDTLHWRYLWFFMGLCTIIINQAAKQQKQMKI